MSPKYRPKLLYKSLNSIREEVVTIAKQVQKRAKDISKKIRPALTPEARENQLISLAVDLAEKQLIEGTASSQVITHYLKLGSTKERIEKEILEKQRELISAKTKAINDAADMKELYAEAIKAMKRYSGNGRDEDD